MIINEFFPIELRNKNPKGAAITLVIMQAITILPTSLYKSVLRPSLFIYNYLLQRRSLTDHIQKITVIFTVTDTPALS